MRRCAAVLAALVLVSGLSGCGRLLGKRYDNFTAYYNTYYNAKREFNREEEELLKAERPVGRDRYLTLFVEPDAQSGNSGRGGFAKAIEKGADLLREHPESKWVDDALLLIGKAYFYQANFSGAEQKFRETIALDENRLEDEAQLWLGRTLTATERYEDAALALREGIDREGAREQWVDQMRLALAEVDVREGEWEEAIASLRTGLDGLRDDALAARASFLLGQVYETTGQPTEAAEAYGRVLRYDPRYQLAYAAQLSQALALGMSGEGERSLDELRRMSRDDKNLENIAEVELTRARVLAAVGRPDEARELIRDLLYDPNPSGRIGNVRGEAHYRLAEVYRDGLRDYVRAAAHYDTAATAIRQDVLPDEQTTAQAITDAPARSESFGSYARVATEIAEMDSLLYLGGLDDEAFAEAIEQIRVQREQEAREQARDLARRRSEQGFQGGPDLEGFDETDRNAPAGNPRPEEGANAGFLNFRNPVQVQEELIAFQARWGERPLVPNWRRAAAIGGGPAVQEGIARDLDGNPQTNTDEYRRNEFVDTSAIPRDPVTQQQMRVRRAAARYELGNVLFLSLSEPDSASVLYRSVIDEDPDSPIAQRAYFALAEAQRALGNTVEADRLYNDVIERYPDSRFADQARGQLGLAPVTRTAAADSLGLAEAAYAEAYARWKAGAYAEALNQMLALSDQYPTTPAAARARLAAGALYTEWAAGNEEVLLAPEPVVLTQPNAEPGEAVRAVTEDSPGVPTQQPVTPSGPTATVFTWVIASKPDSVEAAQIALGYRERGFDARVIAAEVEGKRTYRVGVGQFPGRAEALAFRSALTDDVPADSWLLTLSARPVRASGSVAIFTWIVASKPDSVEAAQIALGYRERGFDARVIAAKVEGKRTYRVGIGQFPGRAEGLASRSALPDDVPAESWLLVVPAVSGEPLTAVVPPPPSAAATQSPAPRSIAPRDSAGVPLDSTFVIADSARIAVADSAGVAPSDLASVSAEEPWLDTLYASIESDFPGTPFAERARVLRTALSGLRQDTPREEVEDAPPADVVTDPLRDEAPIELRKGTFSWSVFASPDRDDAALLMAFLTEDGYRTALYTERNAEGVMYHVLIGQFATQAEAEAVRPALDDIPDTDTYRLMPLLLTGELEQPE